MSALLYSLLGVGLTKIFCEVSDSLRDPGGEEEVVSPRERRTGQEKSDSKKENVDPSSKGFSQVKSIPTPELNLVSSNKFVTTTPNVENQPQVKPSSREKEREKTYRIQTIGEVYALQKREGKEQPTFRRNEGGWSRDSGNGRLALREINEPLLMGTGHASYKMRNSARSKGWRGGRSNDFAYGCQNPGGDEAHATWFSSNGHDDPTQAAAALTYPSNASAGPSAQPHLPDMGNALPSRRRGTLPHQWNQTTREHSHIHETNPALPEGGPDVPQAPPADIVTLHSQMYPSLYGGYGFPYRGPFYNPTVTHPPFPYRVAPPYPIWPILTTGGGFPYPVEYPTPPRSTADSADQQLQMPATGSTFPEANSELNPEEIPWIPGSTPFTSALPVSVIRKARLPDLYVLQGLEYASLRESWEKKLEERESRLPEKEESGAISTAGYAGLVAHNMMEEANPLLTEHLKPRKNLFHETRRYVSMPDSLGWQGRFEEIGNRRQSWGHPACLD